ncbi:MAG TPA: SDR family oxidoreductase [Acidimicrobiia bacterium]|nr:SDR family oxidoreductase [Acidimicrobiia bacterium]
MDKGNVIVVGGTSGIGLEVARRYAGEGDPVVITGRDPARAASIASEIGSNVTGLGFDMADPFQVAPALAGIGPVSRVVLSAILRDENPAKDYRIAAAIELTTMKLVSYVEIIHALLPQLSETSSVVLFGGRAKDRPYPGSTTVTTINGGVSSMIRTLAVELAPIRFNAIHPGIVGDSPYWKDKPLDAVLARTPTRRLVTMDDVVDATVFLLENRSVNGVNLYVDGGWLLV